MPARPRVSTTRRTALGGALLALGAATGCDLDPAGDEPRGPGARAGEDPDTALVAGVLTELGALTALVSAAAARFPRLRAPLTSLRELHLAHRATLGDEGGDEGLEPDAPSLGGPEEALAAVRSRERRAQGRLADAAVAAESGTLARLLASMSAGVAQHLTLLPASVDR